MAIGVLACIVYLAAGRLDIGTAANDVSITPAMAPATQLSFAIDVPVGHRLTPSTIAARASLSIARGRRTALRDLAAVTSALAIVIFGLWLRATGLRPFPIAIAMLAMMTGAASWWRGVSWNADALTPALLAGALWALQGRQRIIAVMLAIAAVVDGWQHLGLVTDLLSEFSMLGACLLVIGVVVLVVTPRTHVVVTIASVVTAALYALRVTDIPVVLFGWAAVAVGIDWLQRVLPANRSTIVVAVVAVVLVAAPALARVRLSSLGRDTDSSLAARAAYDLRPADLPPNAAMIAETRRVDAALRLQSIDIVPQTPAALDDALRGGRVLAAFPGAQANLEPLGFLFERAWFGNIPVSILIAHTPCVDLVDGEWRDISPLAATGAFVLQGPSFGTAPGGAVVKVSAPAATVTAIEPRSIPYEVKDEDGETMIRVPRTGRNDAVTVTLDRSPVSATATADEGGHVTLCAGPLRSPLTLGSRVDASAALRMDDNAAFVSGWHPVEADPDPFRWTAAPASLVRVTMAPAGAARITITATPASRAAQEPRIGVTVNQCALPSRPMPQALTDYEWIAGAECWRPGINDVIVRVTPLISPSSLFATHDTRLLGARIGALRLSRVR